MFVSTDATPVIETVLELQHRFDGAGTALGPEFKLTTVGSWYEQPDVTYNSKADEFFVTWAHWFDPWGAGKVQGARVAAGTEVIQATIDIDPWSRATYGPTSASYDPVRDRYLVAFYRIDPGHTTFGRIIGADGTPVGSRFTIGPTGTYITNGVAYNPISDTYFAVFPHHDIAEIYGAQVTGAGVVDPMFRVTTVLDSNPAVLGVDYPRVAAATDRAEWLATANIWWLGAIGQRVKTNTVGTPGVFSKLSPSNGTGGVPPVEGDRVYLTTTRGEVLCLDVKGQPPDDGKPGPGKAKPVWLWRSLSRECPGLKAVV
jgi:hypothetical protein